MKIKREKLLELVHQRRLKLITDQDARAEQHRESVVTKRNEYIAETRDAWLAFAHVISKAMIERRPVTYELVPEELRLSRYNGCIRFYEGPKTPTTEPDVTQSRDYRSLNMLEKILESTVDDEVSTYALEKMGFKIANLLRTID